MELYPMSNIHKLDNQLVRIDDNSYAILNTPSKQSIVTIVMKTPSTEINCILLRSKSRMPSPRLRLLVAEVSSRATPRKVPATHSQPYETTQHSTKG